jgi:hypothetical protein
MEKVIICPVNGGEVRGSLSAGPVKGVLPKFVHNIIKLFSLHSPRLKGKCWKEGSHGGEAVRSPSPQPLVAFGAARGG